VLREAGFVEVTMDAQRRLYRLRPEVLQEIDALETSPRPYESVNINAKADKEKMTRLKPRT